MSSAERLAGANRYKDKQMLLDIFDEWDSDKNGSISCAEMRKVLLAVGLKSEQVKQLFVDIDANRDGEISFAEFCDWLFGSTSEAGEIKKYVYRTESPKEALHEFMDSVKDIMENENPELKSLKDIFAAIDSSGNKSINISEFVAGAKSLGVRLDKHMLEKLFELIDTERKKVTKRKAPKLKDGWDDDFKKAGRDGKGVNAAKHVTPDVYALAGMPNMNGNDTYYCGNDPNKQGKLVHTAYGEYEEIIEKRDPKTGKITKTRRKVNEGGVPDKLITFKEFEQAFKQAMGELDK
eukprot:TRINITY_DN13123_c0_g1_i1.p1 TRINITY_DN13123_c0_g1~~TRINITY_DN13123_c0_g1_i1.p1  ORF type:complete len:320 (+),score=106.67 TRINITY_DN13123_c0_g1_i1:84-962(+)